MTTIPEQAVEAAARKMYRMRVIQVFRRDGKSAPDETFLDRSEHNGWRNYEEDAREILTAALPLMRADDPGRVKWQLSDEFIELVGLPDDQPGYTMSPPAKAEWALRDVLALPHTACAKCAASDAALERIAGGDGLYPEIARAKLTAIRAMPQHTEQLQEGPIVRQTELLSRLRGSGPLQELRAQAADELDALYKMLRRRHSAAPASPSAEKEKP